MKASDLFVKALENEGVEYIFGIPGEENLDFLESLRKSNIQLILTRHEQAAGFMAATYGRLTRKPGVALSTLGPGATNLLTSTAYAQLGAFAAVFITGQKPLAHCKQAAFQIIDVVRMMRPVTKMSEQITVASTIPYKIRQAFRTAQHEPPGATHLELPEDVSQQDIEEVIIEKRNHRDIGLADGTSIQKTADLIQKAQKPLVMLGASAKRENNCAAISTFIEKTKIPFFSTQMGKGVVDERSAQFLGTAALSSGDYIHEAISASDLIINIGHDIVEKPPFITTSDDCEVVHINYHPADIVKVYRPRYELIGDIAYSIEELTDRLESGQWDFSDFDKIKEQAEKEIWGKDFDEDFPIKPQKLVQTVQRIMPENGMLTLDNGMYKVWFARNYRAYNSKSILLDNALASMGAGLPSAIGAQIVFPERKTMAICGDGGFMMNPGELETAVRLKLNLTVLLINDSGLGMIKWKQDDMGFPDFGLDLQNPDFVKLAESYGAKGARVENASELAEKLKSCVEGEGVYLIEVPVDYSENEELPG